VRIVVLSLVVFYGVQSPSAASAGVQAFALLAGAPDGAAGVLGGTVAGADSGGGAAVPPFVCVTLEPARGTGTLAGVCGAVRAGRCAGATAAAADVERAGAFSAAAGAGLEGAVAAGAGPEGAAASAGAASAAGGAAVLSAAGEGWIEPLAAGDFEAGASDSDPAKKKK
jgi:hypothetical protein